MWRYLWVCSESRHCGWQRMYCITWSVFWQEHGCKKWCFAWMSCSHCSGLVSSVSTTFSSSAWEIARRVPSFGEQVTQSIPSGSGWVPLVSMQIGMPVVCRAVKRASSTCKAGSPPVRMMRGEGLEFRVGSLEFSVESLGLSSFTAATISSALISL